MLECASTLLQAHEVESGVEPIYAALQIAPKISCATPVWRSSTQSVIDAERTIAIYTVHADDDGVQSPREVNAELVAGVSRWSAAARQVGRPSSALQR